MDGRRRALRLLPALPLLGLPGWSAAAPQPARMRYVVIHLDPYGIKGPDGRAAGVFADLAVLLERETGIAMDVILAPYPRALAMVKSGEADLVGSIPNNALAPLAEPLASVFKSEVVAIGRAGSSFNSLAALHGKVVGHIRGAEYAPAFDQDAAIRKYETNGYQQSIQMLLESRYDAIVGFKRSIFYALRSMGLARSVLGQPLHLGEREALLFMSRKTVNPAAAAALAQAMNSLRERGVVKALIDHYFGVLPEE